MRVRGTWALWCLIIGTLGQVAYLTDVIKPHLPWYVAAVLFMVPVSIGSFVRRGEFGNRTVAHWHLLAALWYTAITSLVEVLSWRGYLPRGPFLFRILMHVGWVYWVGVIRDYAS